MNENICADMVDVAKKVDAIVAELEGLGFQNIEDALRTTLTSKAYDKILPDMRRLTYADERPFMGRGHQCDALVIYISFGKLREEHFRSDGYTMNSLDFPAVRGTVYASATQTLPQFGKFPRSATPLQYERRIVSDRHEVTVELLDEWMITVREAVKLIDEYARNPAPLPVIESRSARLARKNKEREEKLEAIRLKKEAEKLAKQAEKEKLKEERRLQNEAKKQAKAA